jgi:F0F1-type ATP synthase epsilon subunit
MTISIEQHIEELRAELRNAVTMNDRRSISQELEIALAELAVIQAEQDGLIGAEPPF